MHNPSFQRTPRKKRAKPLNSNVGHLLPLVAFVPNFPNVFINQFPDLIGNCESRHNAWGILVFDLHKHIAVSQ
jgi:hypothetical protein